MTTLIQIEEAVAELDPQDQRMLLQWLQVRLKSPEGSEREPSSGTEEWFTELADLRSMTATGKQGTPLAEIIDDIREDRN